MVDDWAKNMLGLANEVKNIDKQIIAQREQVLRLQAIRDAQEERLEDCEVRLQSQPARRDKRVTGERGNAIDDLKARKDECVTTEERLDTHERKITQLQASRSAKRKSFHAANARFAGLLNQEDGSRKRPRASSHTE